MLFLRRTQVIRKVCKKLEIPLPFMGYWSKLKYNKPVKKTPLPKNKNTDTPIKIIDNKRHIEEHLQTIYYSLIKTIENNTTLPLTVPQKLTKPHPLIKAAKEDLKNKKASRLLYSNIKSTIHTSTGTIYIDVSKESIPIALKFMDTLIKLLIKRGHQIIYVNGHKLVINGESFKFRFREILKRIKLKDPNSNYDWMHTELIPSGVLAFEFYKDYHSNEWRDSIKKPLEKKLSHILAKLELESERIKKELWHIEYQKKLKLEEERKAKVQNEINKFNQLKFNALKWQESVIIKEYIKAVENNTIKNKSLTDELKEWVKWAYKKAEWYDPILQTPDELFDSLNADRFQ